MKYCIQKLATWSIFLITAYIIFVWGVRIAASVMDVFSIYSVRREWIIGILIVIPMALVFSSKFTTCIEKKWLIKENDTN